MPLTKSDLKQIQELLDNQDKRFDKKLGFLDKRFDLKLGFLREDIDEIFQKYKNEFLAKIDPLLKEVIASREERVIVSD